MKVDNNAFFREATLRICGNLDIEKSLFTTLQYLQNFIPISRLVIEYYDESQGAMRTIAKAGPEGAEQVDLMTPLSPEAVQQAQKKYSADADSVYLFENPNTDILAREMLEFHKIDASSLMVVTLTSGGQPLGTLALISESKEKFSQSHAELISMLREPFAIALSNTLKHRNTYKLFENKFFREATLRICGYLEIEKGLKACFDYISQYIPADAIYLERNEPEMGGMRVIAHADAETCEEMDTLVTYTKEALESMAQMAQTWQGGDLPPVLVINRPMEEPVTRCMLEGLGEPPSSAMSLPLIIGDRVVGALAIIAEGDDRYSEYHAGLYALLKEPFSIAMSNTLKHRNELKLFNRDFFFEVTMRICGNLEIEKGLGECFEYLSQYIPADSIYIERYESELSSNRIIARADSEKAEILDILIPIPKESRASIDELMESLKDDGSSPALVYNDPEKEPVAMHILETLGEPISSVMGLNLILEGQVAGAITVLAEGKDRFTEEHVKLFSTLKLPFFVAVSNALKHQEILAYKDLLVDDNRYLQQELQHSVGENIIGSNFGLKSVMDMVHQVADMDSPVLLLGETGTGKDLVANAIHQSSARREGPFISVNCGAIPESLIDSELFGHEKGAFTGALSQKRGRFERAHGGTIFLDEVGELPLQAQVRLLRVLQNREIERVGGTKTISLDIRVIAATNRDLGLMVSENLFREDLWFRLNVFPISLPPLRDRIPDLPALLQHFITKKARDLKLTSIPELEQGSMDILMTYSWPGNVRELENVVERAIILNRGGPLNFRHLQLDIKDNAVQPGDSGYETTLTLDEVAKRHIQNVLARVKGRIHGPGGAAELLGINPSTLRNRMKKLGIK